MSDAKNLVRPFATPIAQWFKIGIIVVIFATLFCEMIDLLISNWMGSEEYSHGFLIPFITGFLIWQQKNELSEYDFQGSWAGVGLTVGGLLLFFLGELATLQIFTKYAVIVTLMGGVWAITGSRIYKKIWIPLLFLFFCIPLPNFIYQGLSSKLQLWSSALGVSFIRLCDITVYQEGNVIDLGAMQLQVVEACSGLRYLFPLMSLAFMCAYFYKVAMWKRILVFLSSIPITILMNSFRIGVIGVTVEYFGKAAAEGFLHDFEGWIVFMACTAILVSEMWLLARLGRDPRPFQEVFGLTFPEPLPEGTLFRDREMPKQFGAVVTVLLAALVGSMILGHRQEIVPDRFGYADFPLKLGDWSGRRGMLDQQYVDALKFDDYILADYVRAPGANSLPEEEGFKPRGGEIAAPVNFYSAYYASQRKGESIHSPRSCIPGGGWQIASHEVVPVEGVSLYGQPLRVNRLLIQKGEDRQLVYYWFQQRGRDLTNEYLVKWYLFWDALTMNRTDGALVRLTTFVPERDDIADADGRLREFLKAVVPELRKYIPG